MFSTNKKRAAMVAVLGLAIGGVAIAPAHAATKTLTIWADETRGPHLIQLFGALEDQDPGDFVDGYVIDVKAQTNFDALKAALDNATDASGPDIVLGPNDWVSTGVKDGKLASFTLPAAIKADYTVNQLADLSVAGKLYGVPLDINNVAMVRNTGVPKPATFGAMVDYYMAHKTSDGLTAGLCVDSGGPAFAGMSIYSALGMQPYRVANGKIDTKLSKPGKAAASGDPISTSFVQNLKTYLLQSDGTNWSSNGFLSFWNSNTVDCVNDFKAGKIPFTIVGNWQSSLYSDTIFATAQPVPGLTAGTYGNAFGSVSGALLTSFANKHGNLAAAKSLLNYFGSRTGQRDYQKIEKRPTANVKAAKYGNAFQKGFANAANLASIPQVGAILNGTGGNAWWELAGNYWYRVAQHGEDLTATTANLNTLLKANIVAGTK